MSEELKPSMTPLQKAARAVIDRWETPLWKDEAPTGDVIYSLRDALNAELAAAAPTAWAADAVRKALDMPFLSDAKAESVARVLDGIAAPAVEPVPMSREVCMAVMSAYGHLWHANNEPMAPLPMYSPEKAAYAARRHLRDLLTSTERGEAINKVGRLLGRYVDGDSASDRPEEQSAEPVQSGKRLTVDVLRGAIRVLSDRTADGCNIGAGITAPQQSAGIEARVAAHMELVDDYAKDFPFVLGSRTADKRHAAVEASARELAISAQQSAEPVATLHDDGYWTPKPTEAGRLLNDRLLWAGSRVEVYTHPPQRKPEPLTITQIADVARESALARYPGLVNSLAGLRELVSFAHGIERAHGITATDPGGAG